VVSSIHARCRESDEKERSFKKISITIEKGELNNRFDFVKGENIQNKIDIKNFTEE
jgi:hypothetical protein